MPQSSFEQADAAGATTAVGRERCRAHLICERSSVIPPTERSVQSREQTRAAKTAGFTLTPPCVCLATGESLEQYVSSLWGGLWWIAQIWFGYIYVGNTTIGKLWCTSNVLDFCFFERNLCWFQIKSLQITWLRPAVVAKACRNFRSKQTASSSLARSILISLVTSDTSVSGPSCLPYRVMITWTQSAFKIAGEIGFKRLWCLHSLENDKRTLVSCYTPHPAWSFQQFFNLNYWYHNPRLHLVSWVFCPPAHLRNVPYKVWSGRWKMWSLFAKVEMHNFGTSGKTGRSLCINTVFTPFCFASLASAYSSLTTSHANAPSSPTLCVHYTLSALLFHSRVCPSVCA